MKFIFIFFINVLQSGPPNLDTDTFDGLCVPPDWMVWDQKMKRKYGLENSIGLSNKELPKAGRFCKHCGGDLVTMVKQRCCGNPDNRLKRDVHNPISDIFHPRDDVNNNSKKKRRLWITGKNRGKK